MHALGRGRAGPARPVVCLAAGHCQLLQPHPPAHAVWAASAPPGARGAPPGPGTRRGAHVANPVPRPAAGSAHRGRAPQRPARALCRRATAQAPGSAGAWAWPAHWQPDQPVFCQCVPERAGPVRQAPAQGAPLPALCGRFCTAAPRPRPTFGLARCHRGLSGAAPGPGPEGAQRAPPRIGRGEFFRLHRAPALPPGAKAHRAAHAPRAGALCAAPCAPAGHGAAPRRPRAPACPGGQLPGAVVPRGQCAPVAAHAGGLSVAGQHVCQCGRATGRRSAATGLGACQCDGCGQPVPLLCAPPPTGAGVPAGG